MGQLFTVLQFNARMTLETGFNGFIQHTYISFYLFIYIFFLLLSDFNNMRLGVENGVGVEVGWINP